MGTTTPRRLRALTTALIIGAAVLVAMPVQAAPVAATCGGLRVTIEGTDGDDVIEGTNGPDVIAAGAGSDVVYGRGGNDVICGNAGRDTIRGNGGRDRLFGDGGADTLIGNRGGDTISGGAGDDVLRGGPGNDRLRGRSGTDVARGGVFSDVCVAESESSCELDYRGERHEEEWRHLVERYFGDIGETDNALRIIACESNGDPFAVNPRGKVPKGLWQFIPTTWDWATPFSGWEGETRFHPEAATATARWLYEWADDQPGGKGFDPWTHCRCLIPEYGCDFFASPEG